MLDPYCGTGSLLLLPTKLGAVCLGSDINKTYFESTATEKNTLQSNFDFYNLPVPDVFVANTISKIHFYRCRSPFLDCILTDVPFGFRKPRVKYDNGSYDDRVSSPVDLHKAVLAMVFPLYVLGRDCLVVGGRLVFFFPTFAQQEGLVLDEVSLGLNEFNRVEKSSTSSSGCCEEEVDVECVLRLVCVCTEQFKQFQRNLVCVEKRLSYNKRL